jgi:hypothetical protein
VLFLFPIVRALQEGEAEEDENQEGRAGDFLPGFDGEASMIGF